MLKGLHMMWFVTLIMLQTHWETTDKIMHTLIWQAFVRHNMQGILVHKHQVNIIDEHFKIQKKMRPSIGAVGKSFTEKLRCNWNFEYI